MADVELGDKLVAAELERAQLECRRLAIELGKLDAAAPWYQKPLQLLPMLTACISVLAFAFSVAVFAWTQHAQAKSAARNAEREFMRPWLESQWDTYSDALHAAAAATTVDHSDEQAQAEREFWQLYYGRMVMVETKTVSAAMQKVGGCLRAKERCDANARRSTVLELASQMAQSMKDTANMNYETYAQNRFDYVSGLGRGAD